MSTCKAMANSRDLLVIKIKEITGLTLGEFCEKYLFTQYQAFKYRRKTRNYRPNEVMFMALCLGEPVKNLFGEDFLSMMAAQGAPEVEQEVREMLFAAEPATRKRYYRLLGVEVNGSEADPPEAVKRPDSKSAGLEISRTRKVRRPPVVAPPAPEPPEDDDLFDETYKHAIRR